MGSSGGLTGDNIGVEYAGVVFGIAESPKEKGLIWVGTNDGQVQLTRDGGATWTNLTKNLPLLPAWGSVRSIAPSRYDAATAYLTVDAHQENNRDPWVYKTTDYGKSWRLIVNGLPKNMLSYAKVIHEDPVRRGLLYLGTENAIYVSFNAGESWLPLQANLPHAPVSGIVVQEHFNDLVISTYGRGFWILDDITALQQLSDTVLGKSAHLFAPRAAYRFRPITAPSTTYDDPTVGTDPEYGASINYYLGAPAKAPPTVAILDGAGQVIRTLTGPNAAGLNRVHWDLRGTLSSEIRLFTSPMYAPHITPGSDGRVAPGTARLSILHPPGTYTVRLTVDGASQTQQLVVRKDPNSAGTESDIAAQIQVVSSLRDELNTAAAAVGRIETARVQLEALPRLTTDTAMRRSAAAMNQKLIDLEMNLVDLRQTGAGQDGVRFGSKLIAKIGYLANGMAGGDFKPTNQHIEVQQILSAELRTHLAALNVLMTSDLVALNDQLKARNLPTIVDRGAGAKLVP
jgi:hypothetical protein